MLVLLLSLHVVWYFTFVDYPKNSSTAAQVLECGRSIFVYMGTKPAASTLLKCKGEHFCVVRLMRLCIEDGC